MQQWNNRGGGGQRGPGGGAPPRGRDGGHAAPEAAANEIAALLRPPADPPRYFGDNQRSPRPELFGAEAEGTAKQLATLPASQLRRFYAEVMALKGRLERDQEGSVADEEIIAALTLLKAKAAYTKARQRSYPDELVKFFTRHAASVRTRNDFLRGFQPHFEAVMAYHRVFEQKKGDSDR